MPFDPETMMAAQFVVARRVPIMWSDLVAPTPQTRHEMNRMVTEKVATLAAGVAMMPGAFFAGALSVARASHRGTPLPVAVLSGLDTAARAMTSPARRCVRANARRLCG